MDQQIVIDSSMAIVDRRDLLKKKFYKILSENCNEYKVGHDNYFLSITYPSSKKPNLEISSVKTKEHTGAYYFHGKDSLLKIIKDNMDIFELVFPRSEFEYYHIDKRGRR